MTDYMNGNVAECGKQSTVDRHHKVSIALDLAAMSFIDFHIFLILPLSIVSYCYPITHP